MSFSSSQSTDTIVLVKPKHFASDLRAIDNKFTNFQSNLANVSARTAKELKGFINELIKHEIRVILWEDDMDNPYTPASIFPNNVTTTLADGTVIFSAMKVRHDELQKHRLWIHDLGRQDFLVTSIRDYSAWRNQNEFVEGTGSLVLDRVNKIAYAAFSQRTSPKLLEQWGKDQGYEIVCFDAVFRNSPVYHTNVIMALGTHFVLICFAVIPDEADRMRLRKYFQKTGKEILELTEAQFAAYAGNALEVRNKQGKKFVVMSDRAFCSLSPQQKERLTMLCGKILHPHLETIEEIGGGSARCMMLEIFLPKSDEESSSREVH